MYDLKKQQLPRQISSQLRMMLFFIRECNRSEKICLLRGNTTVAGWKLVASFTIFLFYEMWLKAFILHLKNFFFNMAVMPFFLKTMIFKSVGSVSQTILVSSNQFAILHTSFFSD